MSKLFLSLVALTATLVVATPAAATITLVDASSIQGANVLFNNGPQTAALIVGHTQSGTLVNFTGSTTVSNIISASGGQATVDGDLNMITQNPNDTNPLRSLNFSLSAGTFNNLEFNLFGVNDGGRAFFTAIDNNGDVFNFGGANGFALGNGSNFFGFLGIDGQSISSFSISITPGSIQNVQQIRLDEAVAIGAVPEPGTWAMMLLGFGAMGVSLRRRRRSLTLLQAA